MALDSGIHAGMTVFSRSVGLVYNDESSSLVYCRGGFGTRPYECALPRCALRPCWAGLEPAPTNAPYGLKPLASS